MILLNLAALAVFCLLNLAVGVLRRQTAAVRTTVLRVLCALLLCSNLVRYLIVYPVFYHIIKLPAEFSTVAYFVVPLIVLCDWKPLRCWASYSGLLAGFFYYLAMILAGGAIYGADPLWNTVISMACHGTLYVCGLLLCCDNRFARRDGWKLAFGVGYVSVRAAVLRPLVLGRGRMLIYLLLDASLPRAVFPEHVWSLAVPVYYLMIVTALLLSIVRFLERNEALGRHAALCAAQSA